MIGAIEYRPVRLDVGFPRPAWLELRPVDIGIQNTNFRTFSRQRQARFTAVEDLPTPPLPELTAICSSRH